MVLGSDSREAFMELFDTISALRRLSGDWGRAGKRYVLVPSMGFPARRPFGAGAQGPRRVRSRHRRQLRQPAQFGPLEGYHRYRRHLERDLAWLREAGADAVSVPSVAEMYREKTLVFVEPTRVSDHLCAAGRPGHFRGAATVGWPSSSTSSS